MGLEAEAPDLEMFNAPSARAEGSASPRAYPSHLDLDRGALEDSEHSHCRRVRCISLAAIASMRRDAGRGQDGRRRRRGLADAPQPDRGPAGKGEASQISSDIIRD